MHKNGISTAILLLTVILYSSVNALAQADESYLRNIRDEFRKKWPNNRTINIVFHGHSVPTGYFTDGNVHKFNAYPHLSVLQIKEKYPYAVVNSITTSIGGEHAERGETRFANEVLSMRPDVLFIDYALNDRGIGLDRAKVAWQKMIDAALAYTFTDRDGNEHGVKVILMTPTPDTTEDILSESSPLAQHAAQIRQLAMDNNVGLIDSYAVFKDIASRESLSPYMAQANHINGIGHQLVADEIAKLFLKDDDLVSSISEQLITDFESSIDVTPSFGASFDIVENPVNDGINQTDNCGQIKRTTTNWWELIDIPCNFTIPADEVAYLHVLVNYPAQPDVVVRLNDLGNEMNLRTIHEYTDLGEWQDLVFILPGGSSGIDVTNIRFMGDCGFQNSPQGFVLDNESKFGYIDEIIVNNSSARRSVISSYNSIRKKKDYILNSINHVIKFKSFTGQNKHVEIFDISGKKLFSGKKSVLKFRVSKTGLYIVRIDNDVEKVLVL